MKSIHSNTILEAIEAEIVSGIFPPGARLAEASLAERFGVSRTPVREALQSLVTRSLAQRIPFKGVVVSDFDAARISGLFAAMAEIEALCGGFAALNLKEPALEALEMAHHQMAESAKQHSAKAYEMLNTDFHSMIYEGSGNDHLANLAFDLRLKLAPFRRSQLYDLDRMQQSNKEHWLIVQLLAARNKSGVEEALRVHLIGAGEAVLKAREKREKAL
ncbi:MAG: GntR family transcriptional regulator [Roseobacter sp.]